MCTHVCVGGGGGEGGAGDSYPLPGHNKCTLAGWEGGFIDIIIRHYLLLKALSKPAAQ